MQAFLTNTIQLKKKITCCLVQGVFFTISSSTVTYHTEILCPLGRPVTAASVTAVIMTKTQVDNKPQTLAALMSSSATHSAIVLMFLKAASLAPVHSNQMA
jgi:hypothetical protein